MAVFSVGDRVSQPQYGTGTVTAANDHHTVIDFDEHGSRTFSTRLVRLEPSSTPAPAKAAKPRRRTTKKAVAAPVAPPEAAPAEEIVAADDTPATEAE